MPFSPEERRGLAGLEAGEATADDRMSSPSRRLQRLAAQVRGHLARRRSASEHLVWASERARAAGPGGPGHGRLALGDAVRGAGAGCLRGAGDRRRAGRRGRRAGRRRAAGVPAPGRGAARRSACSRSATGAWPAPPSRAGTCCPAGTPTWATPCATGGSWPPTGRCWPTPCVAEARRWRPRPTRARAIEARVRRYLLAMDDVARHKARCIAERVHLDRLPARVDGRERFVLDLAGGGGAVAAELVRRASGLARRRGRHARGRRAGRSACGPARGAAAAPLVRGPRPAERGPARAAGRRSALGRDRALQHRARLRRGGVGQAAGRRPPGRRAGRPRHRPRLLDRRPRSRAGQGGALRPAHAGQHLPGSHLLVGAGRATGSSAHGLATLAPVSLGEGHAQEDTSLVVAARDPRALAAVDVGPLERLASAALELGFARTARLDPAAVVTAAWVREKCRFGCSGLRRGRAVPAALAGAPGHARALCGDYAPRPARAGRAAHGDFHLPDARPRAGGASSRATPRALAFPAGPCRLCPECTPDACVRPGEARPSMEAAGIDVYGTAARRRLAPRARAGPRVARHVPRPPAGGLMRVLLVQAPSVEGRDSEIVAPLGLAMVAAAARARRPPCRPARPQPARRPAARARRRRRPVVPARWWASAFATSTRWPTAAIPTCRCSPPCSRRSAARCPTLRSWRGARVLDVPRGDHGAVPGARRRSCAGGRVRPFPRSSVAGDVGRADLAGGRCRRIAANRRARWCASARDCRRSWWRGRVAPATAAAQDLDQVRTWLPELALTYDGSTTYAPAVGIETKRGCPLSCSYCVYPALQGGRTRFRSPATIVAGGRAAPPRGRGGVGALHRPRAQRSARSLPRGLPAADRAPPARCGGPASFARTRSPATTPSWR